MDSKGFSINYESQEVGGGLRLITKIPLKKGGLKTKIFVIRNLLNEFIDTHFKQIKISI